MNQAYPEDHSKYKVITKGGETAYRVTLGPVRGNFSY